MRRYFYTVLFCLLVVQTTQLFAQSPSYSTVVQTSVVDNKAYLEINMLNLQQTVDTLFARVGSAMHAIDSLSCTWMKYQGHVYELVLIGDQCWFAENLRAEQYRNGDAIPEVTDDVTWASTSVGARAAYSNDAANVSTYGYLYNWFAVDSAAGLCPGGWHVSSDGEWTELTDFLDGESVAGAQMKSSSSDTPSWDGTNSSGFSALPGGYRSYDGNFNIVGYSGFWWSASPDGNNAWNRSLDSDSANVNRNNDSQRYGFSVRCVRD